MSEEKIVVLEISDKNKKNTTKTKIKKSLSKYKISPDVVRFKIVDLYNPPTEDYKWQRIAEELYDLVNDYYQNDISYSEDNLFTIAKDIKVEIEVSKNY